ncbi:dinuclear metal center protein, YbgI/SA1388 family [Amphibacillus marinus]|uniref:GTP cyclohydrolase 1 type 2 homolog n=1 Tax=Amphibacillus marinus TaxID=872970 RepID=A0A1H8HI43_9BACI|nr:Nif3-like dinuclear metal center hexameric protein [Amphibacillus marinus]SEN55734.1 dinuclear metal center protein, YbgI/SA1388 family [Amphibacillus marinus]
MTKQPTVGTIIELIEQWAPKKLAYDWDNVGLQVGKLSQPVHKLLISLDVTEQVVDEAIAQQVDCIIVHHPLLFKPLKQINLADPTGKIIAKLIKHDITVYAAHTNLDIAHGGVNDMLADRLKLQDSSIMIPEREEKQYKLHVYVPVSHLQAVDQALTQIGVGQYGNYAGCSYTTEGIGAFTPNQQAIPYLGQAGVKENVKEMKIEYMLPQSLARQAITVLKAAHPYEEPAYDLIELQNHQEVKGLGRVGYLATSMELAEFSKYVKEVFQLSAVNVTGQLDKKINKVAVLGGSGEKYIGQAKRLGADVYVTGDITFHSAQDAEALGLALIDAGHHIEQIMVEGVQHYLAQSFKDQQITIDIITSKVNTNPFQTL